MEYDYSDLRSSDIVLDLGACCGVFSILVSDQVKTVYAVEPLYHDLLLENLYLNKISNVNIISCAISSKLCNLLINYDPRTSVVCGIPFDSLMSLINTPIDFLKMDIEMAEWLITSNQLAQFRRIEVEVHNFDGKHDIENFETIVENAGFEYITDTIEGSPTHIIHGFK